MKSIVRSLIVAVTLVFAFSVSTTAQTLMLWDDQQDIISSAGETLLLAKLAENDIEVVMSLDYKKRCEYLYAELTQTLNQATLNIYDCNRNVRGSKSWMSKFFGLSEEEKVTMISFAIVEIVEKPQIGNAEQPKDVRFNDGTFTIPFNHHNTRYFFSPTSYNLKRGELYYSTLYFMTHDLQYGITDHFSVGMGTTVALMPFYITPKYSFAANDKHAFSIGTMMMVGTWGVDFFGNLGYGTYTYGNQFSNVTLGLGHLYAQAGESAEKYSEPVINVGAMARISDYIYFVTENYYVNLNSNISADYYGVPKNEWGWWDGPRLFTENFELKTNYIAGMSGFRFINKNRNVNAFQFGLTYVVRMQDKIPSKYDPMYWNVDQPWQWKTFVIPTISFVSKLGKRV
ncbi:MAG: hypothetical protein R6V49_06455 [Bacteroidales bacterium]